MFTPVNMQNRVKHEWRALQVQGQKQNGKHKKPHVMWAAVHVLTKHKGKTFHAFQSFIHGPNEGAMC